MKKTKAAPASLLTLNKIAAVVVLGCSCLLFLDYLLPGLLVHTPIERYDVFTTRVRGGAATTYNIITDQYEFPITEEFLAVSEVGDTVNLEVSRMLKIINSYGLKDERASHIYYTRYLTGLVFPLILMLVSLFCLRLRSASENTIHLLLGLQALAIFIFIMTLLNISHLF